MKKDIQNIPKWILILVLPLFVFTTYMGIKMFNSFTPLLLGKSVTPKVIEIDSLESYKKNKTYSYFGKIKFELEKQEIITKYKFNEQKKNGDKLDLYYHKKYGFYNPEEFYFILVLGSVFFSISIFLFYILYLFLKKNLF